MNLLIDRIAELAGPEVAAQITADFGGATHYIAAATPLPANAPTRVRLDGHFNLAHPVWRVAESMADALQGLASAGIQVNAVYVEPRGLGDAYIDALQAQPALHGLPVAAFTAPPSCPALSPALAAATSALQPPPIGSSIYMPKPSPFASETPEARRARHQRRFHQIRAGNVEAPPEIPARPLAGLGVTVPKPADAQ